ncbi:MAG TPA: NADH-quinone oxidoreductase subunit C, partial [Thermoplasmata archaeon]|nr:NADH-quinone oxidoreductase subunit C [Thermoplasmata archaeon]
GESLHHPLSTFFGEDARRLHGGIRVHALFLDTLPSGGVHLLCALDPGRPNLPTLSRTLPYVAPFEREVAEMFGVVFDGSEDRRPLLLHERHPAPPLLKGPASPPDGQRVDYPFAPVEGEGIYEVPVGPVHAGVIEPGHFRFQVVGEKILNLEVRLGYTHKGTERLFEGKPSALGTVWAESVSGDMSVAGAVAYTHAVERALEIPVRPADELVRGVLLETERIAFLCGDVAGIALDVGYPVGAAEANRLREAAYQVLRGLTGSRLGRGIVGIGGLRRPVTVRSAAELERFYEGIAERIEDLREQLIGKSSVLDRLQGTGTIPRWTAELMHFVGPTARASGLRIDVRHDRPYGAYLGQEVRVPRGIDGDVQARLVVKVEEIVEACRLARRFLPGAVEAGTPANEVLHAPPSEGRSGLGWVESPRGEFLVHVTLGPGARLERVYVRDPSFLNWPAIEFAVRENIVPDFPLCNKSLNLSYSGYDR